MFTSSKTGPVNPIEVSDDVSLVQPYDGSGWVMANPAEWFAQQTGAAAAAGSTNLFINDLENVVRILAVSCSLTAGNAISALMMVTVPGALGDVAIGSVAAITSTEHILVPTQSPILGPGHTLVGRHFGGNAGSIPQWRIYLVQAPIGTVFYV